MTAASLQLEKLVVDIETGIRGLTLTARARFLEPYTGRLRQLPSRTSRRAAALVADDPAQRARRAQAARCRGSTSTSTTSRRPLVVLVRETPGIVARTAARRDEGKRLTRTRFGALFASSSAAEDELAATAAADAERRSERRGHRRRVGIAASTPLIILFGIILARSIGRPVRAVASGATRLAAASWSLRLPTQGAGEIGELTRAFNEMAERLEQGQAELRGAERQSSARASG